VYYYIIIHIKEGYIMTTFETAVIGDRVWSITYGWGTIDKFTDNEYKLEVEFDNKSVSTYTLDGRYSTSQMQTLFWDVIEIVAPEKSLKKPTILEVDTLLEVWDDNFSKVKVKRFFSHFDEEGRVNCFLRGLHLK
jgi:hypothetical protein